MTRIARGGSDEKGNFTVKDNDRIRQQIHDYIVANFLFGTMDVDDDANLVDEGVVDSTGVVELVQFAEEALGVAISDDELLPEHFESVNSLAAFVAQKIGSVTQATPAAAGAERSAT